MVECAWNANYSKVFHLEDYRPRENDEDWTKLEAELSQKLNVRSGETAAAEKYQLMT